MGQREHSKLVPMQPPYFFFLKLIKRPFFSSRTHSLFLIILFFISHPPSSHSHIFFSTPCFACPLSYISSRFGARQHRRLPRMMIGHPRTL
ncbi:hypothetical protein BC940DRAFT_313769 [Gongronella butleri]|nr:hypothetical protein BC940DRAFT_313769 [Gongronella butleri]